MYLLYVANNILLFVAGLGILQAILLCSLLYFHPKSDRSVNLFLGLYVISLSLPMLMPLIQHLFYWQGTTFVDPILSLVGPSLYLYVKGFKEIITWKKAWPHYLFFLANVLGDIWFYYAVASKYDSSSIFPAEAINHPILISTVLIRVVQLLIYYFLSRRSLASYQKSIKHIFSETTQINLNWMKWLINGYLFLVLFMLFIFIFILSYPEYFTLLSLAHSAVLTPYIYIVTYKGIFQPSLWQFHQNIDKKQVEKNMQQAEEIENLGTGLQRKATLKTGLDKTKLESLLVRVISLVENEKIYQEPELTLQQLADKLNVPAYQVSLTLNEGMKRTFYDLINGYRVNEAKKLLTDSKNKNFTILSVGFEAGFNSKTAFNTVFKKLTGLTPTEYRDRNTKTIDYN